MAKNGVNPNTPQFFDNLYNGIWEIGDFKTEWFYEEEEKIAFYRRLAALPFFDFSGRILDVGCGMGGVLAQIPGEGMEKYGIDFSATAIEKISKRLRGTFVVGDVHKLPFDTDFFDRILCTETLEHVDDPTAVMAEMARVLKPGGKLLITVPEHSHDLATEHWPDGVNLHINKYTIFSLKRMLIDADLIVQSAELNMREIWLTAVKAPVVCRVPVEVGSGLVAKESTAAGNLLRAECGGGSPVKVNLCCGPVRVDGYLNAGITPGTDLRLDLEQELLPFPDDSVDILACISAISYFTRERGVQIVRDVHRVLKPGGVARFASQDLRLLASHYLDRDTAYFDEKLADGRDRYPGATLADKFNGFIYGLNSEGKNRRYVYDFEGLREVFREAGFAQVEERRFRESRIREVEQIDIRPEQMFFLEAVKEAPASAGVVPCQPDALMRQGGAEEREWQCLLKALELDPTDRKALAACAGILSRNGRLEDQAKLYRAFLEKRPGDPEIRRMLAENEAIPRQSREAERRVAQRRALLQTNSRLGPILPDREHLAAAMGWLRRAQEGNAGSGVSAIYYQDRGRWEVDSPDNTGTIIPTFLAYARLTGDGRYREWAHDMADWELAIQSPEGGAGEPVGVYGLRPRVFNTGQVILGWVSLYRESGDAGYLAAARRAGDWIVGSLDADGAWRRNTCQGPHPYKSRVSWALLELYAVTGDGKYREGAERSLTWILGQALDNGWFDNNSLAQPGRPWSHLIAHVLVGLLEICRLGNARCDRERILTLLSNAARGMVSHYLTAKERAGGRFVTLAATFDRTWGSSDPWSCLAGTAQVEFFLRRLARLVDNPQLLMAADMLIDDLKRLQLMEGVDDPLAIGGLHGSYPIEASYCSFAIPTWGVKFFADSLLQRLLPAGDELQAG